MCGLAMAGMLLACGETGIDGRADGATDVDCMEPDPDSEPGGCFEIFGPRGISHDPPRRGDIGVVGVGGTIHAGIGFYNFCGDYEGLNVGTYLIDTEEFTSSSAFRVASAPDPCSPIPEIDWGVWIDFVPLVGGFHRAMVRYEVTHGHYDFEFFAEAVESGDSARPLAFDCLELDDTLVFRETRPGSTTSGWLDLTFTCTIPWAEAHLLISRASIVGEDADAFEFFSPFHAIAFSPVEPSTDYSFPQIDFTPPSAGVHRAELVLVTNEPVGEYRVTLTGTGSE